MAGKKGVRSRPPRLTPQREEILVAAVQAGENLRSSAEAAGLGYRTVERYLARGLAAQQHLDRHIAALTDLRRQILDRWDDERTDRYLLHHTPPLEHVYWQLWRKVTRARAQAEAWSVAQIREVGNGYHSEETVTEQKQVLDREGQVVTLTTTRTVRRFVKDWRAHAFLLQQGPARDEWYRKPERLELTGAEGGPVETRDVTAARAEAMQALDELDARRAAAVAAGRLTPAGETPQGGDPAQGGDPGRNGHAASSDG